MSQLVQVRVPCANVKEGADGSVNCVTLANSICSKCYLVHYCGRECQAAHWPQHKLDCKSAFRNASWQPAWASEGRQPAFMSTTKSSVSFGGVNYLYGNVAAYDTLNMAHNEGMTHNQDLNLCFAASGDLRNIIKTIVGIPDDYNGTALCIVNDRDLLVVARNVVMLLTSLGFPPVIAAEMILHIWYSARLKPEMLQNVKDRVRPLIAQVVEDIEQKKNGTLLSATWTLGSRVLSIRLFKYQWDFILKLLDAEHPVSKSEAQRENVMLNHTRVDYRERMLFQMSPSRRVCSVKMRESGMLLPFGSCLDEYTCSNPTMFDIESCEWLLSDSSDPLAGWALDDILTSEARRGGPKEDIYGLMHLHVRHLLETFCRKTALLKVHMHLYCLDATKLPLVLEPRLKQSGFDRIEVANIADEDYIGLDASLSTFGPLLKSPMSNPHATLITLIMNTVNQAARDLVLDVDIQNTYIPKVTQFLGYRPSQKADLNDPETLRFLTAIDLVRDYKKIWDQYEQREDFPTMVKKKSMKAKLKNTVVEPWPMRLYKEPREPGAQEAFNRLMESGSMGSEHYIEWVRSE